MSALEWQINIGYTLDAAQTTRRPILLELYNPECIGCQQMDAVTYSAEEVVAFINNYLIPLRLRTDDDSVHERYQTIWTPTTMVLDRNGFEVQRKIGFLDPSELIAALRLGLAKVHMNSGEHDTAEMRLKNLIQEFQDSTMVPEAIFFRGVNRYKWKDDPAQLKAAYETLKTEHPENTWTKRAAPYRLLN